MNEQSTEVVEARTAELEAGSGGDVVRSGGPEPTHDDHHPSPRQYVLIGLVLVVVTAVEVSLYYLEDTVDDNIIIVALLLLGGLKFFFVAAWYMHLRTDKPMLRQMFLIGLIAAGVLYSIVLLTFPLAIF